MKARVKTAEEITGVKGMESFEMDNYVLYLPLFNKIGIVEVEKTDGTSKYEFRDAEGYTYLADWLEFLPEPDLEMDAKVLVWDRDGIKRRRYFAGKFRDGKIGCWGDGKTSWSTCDIHYWEKWEWWNENNLP